MLISKSACGSDFKSRRNENETETDGVAARFVHGDRVAAGNGYGGYRRIYRQSDGAQRKRKYYTSVSELANYVKDLSDRSFIIDMLADWDNTRLCIPSKAWATLNMHGHLYNRGLKKAESDGEVIWVGSDARLTINGSGTNDERNIEHAVGVYHDWRHEGKADVQKTFRGGVIASGYSTNGGGGIDVKSNCILTLNDVTIAGCRSEQSGGTDGYGGGIWVHGGINEAGTVIMNYTTITGCYAYNSGGGLYQSNHNKFYMEMNQSHIDSNYCYSNGGVYLGGASITLKGDRGSYISSNRTGGGKNQNGAGFTSTTTTYL